MNPVERGWLHLHQEDAMKKILSKNIKKVQLSPQLLIDIFNHVKQGLKEHPHQERMGFLFGRSLRNTLQIETYLPYKGGLRTSMFIEYEPLKTQARIEHFSRKTHIEYYGTYHSHPLLHYERVLTDFYELAELSEADIEDLLDEPAGDIELIVAIAHGENLPEMYDWKKARVLAFKSSKRLISLFISTKKNKLLWFIPGGGNWIALFTCWYHDPDEGLRQVRIITDQKIAYWGKGIWLSHT